LDILLVKFVFGAAVLTREGANPKTLTDDGAEWASQRKTNDLSGVCAPLGLLPLERPGLACAEDTTFAIGE
jgi:hypothetical protein